MRIFIVSFTDGECMASRAYSKREYAEALVKWCKNHNLKYHFAEEYVDRDIVEEGEEECAKNAKNVPII